MDIVVRTSKGGKRVYLYEQTSYRDPKTGKVKSPTKYIGPKYPKRKRGGVLSQFLKGGLSIAVNAVNGTLPPPGGVTHSVTGQIGDRRSWEPERSVEAIQAKARTAATPDGKPVDLELLDMVRQFEAHLKASVENKGNSTDGKDGDKADASESQSGKDDVGVEVEVDANEGNNEPS